MSVESSSMLNRLIEFGTCRRNVPKGELQRFKFCREKLFVRNVQFGHVELFGDINSDILDIFMDENCRT